LPRIASRAEHKNAAYRLVVASSEQHHIILGNAQINRVISHVGAVDDGESSYPTAFALLVRLLLAGSKPTTLPTGLWWNLALKRRISARFKMVRLTRYETPVYPFVA